MAEKLGRIYERLRARYGPRGWWPTTPPGGGPPRYHPGRYRPRDGREAFEVCVGAILTQNTAWKNAARAIEALAARRLLSSAALVRVRQRELAEVVRPSGYFNQKAERLRIFARWVEGLGEVQRVRTPALRERLLELKGIGPETADSMLLYGYSRPVFVVDAYTRRVLVRVGLASETASYDTLKELFEASLPRRLGLFNEYHALLVQLAKDHCRKRPICEGCPIEPLCDKRGLGERAGARK